MKYLTYTEEMQKNDQLLMEEEADLDLMEKHYEVILKEAKENGFKGDYIITRLSDTVVAEIFANEVEKNYVSLTGASARVEVDNAGALIVELQEIINKPQKDFVITLTKTNEMETHDLLIESGKEDKQKTEEYFNKVLEEATVEYGFEGTCGIHFDTEGKPAVTFYYDENEKKYFEENRKMREQQLVSCKTVKELVEILEGILNLKWEVKKML